MRRYDKNAVPMVIANLRDEPLGKVNCFNRDS